MKKLLLSLAFLITFCSYSQNSKFKFGIQAGLNYSTFYGYNVPTLYSQFYSESAAFAYLGGINIEYKIKERLSLKVELNYELKSQKADNTIEIRESAEDFSQIYNFTSKRTYYYLVLPLLLKYEFTPKNSFYLNGGPFIGYLLKSEITSDLEMPGSNTDFDTTGDNNKTDFGLSFGLGKNFDISSNKTINIEIRENLGLYNTSKVDVWNGGSIKTNSINLLVGFSLN